jgi:hypothetical protein
LNQGCRSEACSERIAADAPSHSAATDRHRDRAGCCTLRIRPMGDDMGLTSLHRVDRIRANSANREWTAPLGSAPDLARLDCNLVRLVCSSASVAEARRRLLEQRPHPGDWGHVRQFRGW